MTFPSRLLIILLLAVACRPLAAAEVRGTVCGIDGRPLPGVRVRAGNDFGEQVTNERGVFVFRAADGAALTLDFESPGHHPERRTVVLRRERTRLTVFLIPLRLLREDVVVTARDGADRAAAVPVAQSTVAAPVLAAEQPESVVAAVQRLPGVHFIGKGGLAVTPSIRGLARRRVLLLVDGARITSDRSAGTSAHFFPAEMARQIEVLRSASSVLYGSDAMGGVLQVLPAAIHDPEAGWLALNWAGGSAAERAQGGLALRGGAGTIRLLAGLQATRAGDYAAAGVTVLNSGYRYLTGRFAAERETERRSWRLSVLLAAGRDVGKPERANDPAVSSTYPTENTRLIQFSCRESALFPDLDVTFTAYANPNDYALKKVKRTAGRTEIARNSAFDYGFRLAMKKKPAAAFTFQAGIDGYGRAGVDMENETRDGGAVSFSCRPLARGRRLDLGLYALGGWSLASGWDLQAGVRLGAFSRAAVSAGEALRSSSLAPAFFVGLSRRLGRQWSLFLNAATAFRMPSLSESFYSGITGRSSVVGNPGLEPEKSLNVDAGVKFRGRFHRAGAYFFQTSLRGLIEKFPLAADAYTYANVDSGLVRGWEIELMTQPLDRLELFASAFQCRGRSAAAGGALNDVPSAKLHLGARLWLGRFWCEGNWEASAAQRRPGPAEVAVAAYSVAGLKAGCFLSRRLALQMRVSNLGDRLYYPNADHDVPPAKGIDLAAGLNLNL